MILFLAAVVMLPMDALAFEIDTSEAAKTKFGYELYDFMFNTVLGGFIGICAMSGITIMGILQLVKGRWEVMLLSAAVVISIAKLESILKSLGCTLSDVETITNVTSNIGYLIW
jgi:hypothetical protein